MIGSLLKVLDMDFGGALALAHPGEGNRVQYNFF